MEWIKVKEKLPEFEELVLLGQVEGESFKLTLGYLSKIDANGAHFETANSMAIFNLTPSTIVPDFWCKIEIPKIRKK